MNATCFLQEIKHNPLNSNHILANNMVNFDMKYCIQYKLACPSLHVQNKNILMDF